MDEETIKKVIVLGRCKDCTRVKNAEGKPFCGLYKKKTADKEKKWFHKGWSEITNEDECFLWNPVRPGDQFISVKDNALVVKQH